MPEARRHFIDRGVASLRPAYVQTVSDYNKVIKQKNRILQDSQERELRPEETENLIAPWNQQLVRLGVEIHRARVDYTEQQIQELANVKLEQIRHDLTTNTHDLGVARRSVGDSRGERCDDKNKIASG
jgi:recombinational DNA repair ATPase RecF